MPAMTDSDTSQLAQLIDRKYQCLTELREAGRRQLQFVRDDRIAGLLELLAAKQKLLNGLQRIERALDPFRDQPPESRHWESSALRDACSAKINQCEKLLREIVAQERESEAMLTHHRNLAAEQLQEVHHAGEARGAYLAGSPHRRGGLDLSTE